MRANNCTVHASLSYSSVPAERWGSKNGVQGIQLSQKARKIESTKLHITSDGPNNLQRSLHKRIVD
jgi:hypothetical protein